ncbi:hypothetical protein BGZ60DRAFT_418195 [Tricladium varicosporioides]|nr:hypothetical protein BGZ60DRAFT_418195 [Hymenoscyphus varicosporioides]
MKPNSKIWVDNVSNRFITLVSIWLYSMPLLRFSSSVPFRIFWIRLKIFISSPPGQ